MPIDDKVAAAKKISELLNNIFAAGDFRLRYKITVDPQVGAEREWERPEILVELSGSDSSLALENGGELLRAFEHVSLEMLRLRLTSTRRSALTARISAPHACRSCAWLRMWPPRKSAKPACPTHSLLCRRGSAASSTSLCGTRKISVRRAEARQRSVTLSSIPRTTRGSRRLRRSRAADGSERLLCRSYKGFPNLPVVQHFSILPFSAILSQNVVTFFRPESG